jgi:tungstate transport system permease protein
MALDPIVEGIRHAVEMILAGDPVVIEVTLRSLQVSIVATLIALLIGLPIGIALGMYSFPGRRLVKSFFNALLGIPTVVLGLLLYLLLVPAGPFGSLRLLYTVMGISIGEALLIIPIIVSCWTKTSASWR